MGLSLAKLLSVIESVEGGLTLNEILSLSPDYARRTAQRHIAKLIDGGEVLAVGQGRARRYFAVEKTDAVGSTRSSTDSFPPVIPWSADSRDILAYIKQPIQARNPVGYQHDFLDAYQPNRTRYLSEALSRQLYKMGKTAEIDQPAGTYSRAILNRLLIDLSWASSSLEGNTYSRLDTRKLIEHGTAAIGKGAIETQMILNHKEAIELLVENIDSTELNRYTFVNEFAQCIGRKSIAQPIR